MRVIKHKNARRSPICNNCGVTLVELVVAAVVMVVAVIAVVAVVRKSTEMQVNDNHRRQARAAIMRQFETAFFRYQNEPGDDGEIKYRTEYEFEVDDDEEPVPFEIIVNNKPMKELPDSLTISKGSKEGESSEIKGVMLFGAVAGKENIGSQEIPYHDITLRVRWREADGTLDSVELTKRLAAIHDR